jgi:SRSO17 transposase
MTKRLPVSPAPGPLEEYAVRFDDLFRARAQREGFRRYLEGLLLPAERNKTLTALANTEPVAGAQRKEAQSLQWFLSESRWDPEEINRRRVELLLEDCATAPSERGALVIDETGDRKDGKKTAHVGRQYLSSIGKIDNGVVSVSSLWADERVYYPLEVEPYTPAHHFEGGKEDPRFRTKPQIALELVEAAIEMGIAFRAVVADILYGEHRGFRKGLERKRIPYVLALKPSYAWYHPMGEPGTVEEIARVAPWDSPDDPGEWVKLLRTFRNGHTQEWWALEAECRPFGKEKQRRLVVATTDPAELPELTTCYLMTDLPAPGSSKVAESELEAAGVAEVVRLYSLRSWIEQSYKQVKNSLGWAHYQVRSDPAMRRHWQLVCCAFTFCWWANIDLLEEDAPPGVVFEREEVASTSASMVQRGKKENRKPASSVLARGTKEGEDVAGAVRNAVAILEGVLREAPAEGTAKAA